MPDGFDLNNQSKATEAAPPAIPTSASEVAVRTMTSDLELMGQSGGMVSQSAPQGVQVPVTLHPDAAAAGEAPAAPSGRGKHILITVGVIVGVLVLLALGYFLAGSLF